jgi:GNAT superfamily N-acetyltransferase
VSADEAFAVAEAYRWHRRLGNTTIGTPYCCIVANRLRPEVWDANHADDVTARTDAEADEVLAAMELHLAHTPWRVVHTDCQTPDAFLARLAFEDFVERPTTIQMAFQGTPVEQGASIDLRPVVTEADWEGLLQLVLIDHAEGRTLGGLEISPEVSAAMVAGYRTKSEACQFHLAIEDGFPVAFGACAAAPNGVGMIEDLFTLPKARRRGIATGMIAAFIRNLRAAECQIVFLGALAAERPKRLYARLGFQPVGLARSWVRRA